MSRYIDADKIEWRLIIPTNATTAEENMIYHARKLVESQPTADVVDVVRCKDCKWYKSIYSSIYSWNGNEHKICAREPSDSPREPDDYCIYGERREDGEVL